jgi:hypothetical protein
MRIGARYNGPPGSGNGGYSAGLITAAFPEFPIAEVTLRSRPPLETWLVRRDTGVYDDDRLVATVASGPAVDRAVAPVSRTDAERAAMGYSGFVDHPFPTCYVCGPTRDIGDGLRIFPGPAGEGRTAAPWTVPEGVDVPTVWAALDCPGGWSVIAPGRPYVLGRITVAISVVPQPYEECVVVGECVGVDGRKAFTYTALYESSGALCATGQATWIAV